MIATLNNNAPKAVTFITLDGKSINNAIFADDFNGKVTIQEVVPGQPEPVNRDLTGVVSIGMDKDWCYDYMTRQFRRIKDVK